MRITALVIVRMAERGIAVYRYDKRSCMMQSRLIPPVKSLPMDGVMIESE